MKVQEGMGSIRKWVSHTSKRGLPRRLEGAVPGYAELKREAGRCRVRKVHDKVRTEENYLIWTSLGTTELSDSR